MMSTGFVPGATMLSTSTYEDKRTALEEEEELMGTDASVAEKIAVSFKASKFKNQSKLKTSSKFQKVMIPQLR